MSKQIFLYCVITKVPDPSVTDGNMYDDIVFRDKYGHQYVFSVEDLRSWSADPKPEEAGEIRIPIFHLGEIVILDLYGKEVTSQCRKPVECMVDYEVYECVEDAIERAVEIEQCCSEDRPIPDPKVAPMQSFRDATEAPQIERDLKRIREDAGCFTCPKCRLYTGIENRGTGELCKACERGLLIALTVLGMFL